VALTDAAVRALRLRAQRLTGERPTTVAGAVAAVGALQAQATPAARLAVRARTTTVDAVAVDEACATGAVVRTWANRGTLHMLAASDVRWVVGMLGPVFAAAGRGRRRQLGLDDATCERGLAAIAGALAGSPPLTRAELVARIADSGVRLDARTQAPAHLIGYAALCGLICRGPERGSEPTYVLLDDWVPATGAVAAGEQAAGEEKLARRYLAGHGPASAVDFAAWSGLPVTRCRAAFAAIQDGTVDLGPAGTVLSTMDLTAPRERSVRLLGHFDAYLLGWRRRDLVLDPAHAKRIQAGGGMILPAVLVDGRVVGTWRLDRRGDSGRVSVEPFDTLPRGSRAGLEREVADLGRFLRIDATLAVGLP
jgi:hypothetical protein